MLTRSGRQVRSMILVLGSVAAAMLPATTAVAAETCSRNDLAAAVDKAGEALRRLNVQTLPRLQAKMRQLKEAKNLPEADEQEQITAMLVDYRTAELDAQANDLLARIDTLGTPPPDGAIACSAIGEIDATTIELIATIRAKTAHTFGRIDALLAEAEPPRPTTVAPAPVVKAEPEVKVAPPPARPEPKVAVVTPPPVAKPSPKPAPKATEPTPAPGWKTETTVEPSAGRLPPPANPPPAAVFIAPDPAVDGYTIEEIQDATRGVFGQVSTGLAGIIEHAFRRSGRPTAYVVGDEGGGAFVAGLRYGTGTLYLRSGGTRTVYWHGPSVGYDLGLTGSKVMYLIYGLANEKQLFNRFTGIDGAAYVVGGVGVTFLTDGQITMAPIRSGLGLRLGASIGYVRFTERATWNPF